VKVFVGACSIDSSDLKYSQMAVRIGEYLGKNDYTYVQGNCINGMMGKTYNEFKRHSDKIIMYGMKGDEMYPETVELLDTFDLRTKKLIENCDVALFLPGGDCTIQEIATFNQYNREHPGAHLLILVNINGFYQPLINQYQNILDKGLNNNVNFFDSFIIVKTLDDAIKIIEEKRS